MAATFTHVDPDRTIHAVGDLLCLLVDVTFSGSYATGGDALDLESVLRQIGLGQVYAVLGSKQGYSFAYDSATDKVLVYSAAGTELAAAAYPAALTGSTARLVVIGR